MTQELFGDIGRRSSDDIGQNQGGVSFRAVGGQLCANRIGNGSRVCIGGYIHRNETIKAVRIVAVHMRRALLESGGKRRMRNNQDRSRHKGPLGNAEKPIVSEPINRPKRLKID